MIFLTNMDLNQNELENVRIQNLAVDPASPVTGQIWFNTAISQFKYYDGVSTLVIPEDAIAGTTAPTTSLMGNIGQLYLDTVHTKLYVCIAKSESACSWKEILFTEDIPPFEDDEDNIKMDGEASVGSLSTIPRADHVHPTDTSRVSIKPNGTDLLLVDNKLNTKYIPDSILGQLEYKGTFNASSGGTITGLEKGWYYICSASGSKNPDGTAASESYSVGDWAVYNGASWDKVDNTDAVTMVNSQIGAVETYKGAWASSTKYYKGDIVLQSSSLWLCKVTHTSGSSFVETNWQIFGKVYTASNGITLDGTNFKHSNSVSAKTSQAVYPITFDAQGHITGAGTAQTILKRITASFTADGVKTSWTISHGLGNKNVIIQVFDTSTNEMVLADVVLTSTSSATVQFATPPVSGKQYYAVVIG